MIKGKDLGVHTTVRLSEEGWWIVRYHNTDVVKWNENTRKVMLDSGGYRTVTTKRRMNQILTLLGSAFRVYQIDYKWYTGLHEDFYDGIEFKY